MKYFIFTLAKGVACSSLLLRAQSQPRNYGGAEKAVDPHHLRNQLHQELPPGVTVVHVGDIGIEAPPYDE